MFSGVITTENFTGDDLIELADRIVCLGEVLTFLAWGDSQSHEPGFGRWGERFGDIIRDYGVILGGVLQEHYSYINPALEEANDRAMESRRRCYLGLVDPPVTADEILARPSLYVRGAEGAETCKMSDEERREWAEKRAEELNNALGWKRREEMTNEELIERNARAHAGESEGCGEVVFGYALKPEAKHGQ